MTAAVERVVADLTPAQRRAIRDAFDASWGEAFVPMATCWNVRRRLVDKGLLSRRTGMPLRKLGLAVRAHLQAEGRPA